MLGRSPRSLWVLFTSYIKPAHQSFIQNEALAPQISVLVFYSKLVVFLAHPQIILTRARLVA